MQSPPVLKLILENTSTDRIAAAVDSSPSRVRAWLKARGVLPERRPATTAGGASNLAFGASDQRR
jgi:hypothetical protein